MQQPKQLTLKDDTTLKAVAICMFASADVLSYTIIKPFLPHYLTYRFPKIDYRWRGIDMGWILGIFFFGRFLTSLFAGHVVDTYGRKPFLVFSLLICASCIALFPLLESIAAMVILRFFHGLLSATSAISRAQMADITSSPFISVDNRSILFAFMVTSLSLASAGSSMIGGTIAGLGTSGGFSNPYQVACWAAACCVAAVLLLSVFFPETKSQISKEYHLSPVAEDEEPVSHPPKYGDKGMVEEIKTLFRSPLRVKLFVIFGLNSMANAAYYIVWVLVGGAALKWGGFGFGPLSVGMLFGIYGVASCVFQFTFFKPVVKRFGLLWTFRQGAVIQFSQCYLFALIVVMNNLGLVFIQARYLVLWCLIIIYAVIAAVGNMMTLSISQSMIVNTTDPTQRGLVQGVNEMIATFSKAVGSVVFGYLYSYFAHSAGSSIPIFLFLSSIYFVCFILSMLISAEQVEAT
jgi:MFS family permease